MLFRSRPWINGVRCFSFEELKKCTKNFSNANILGSGGFRQVRLLVCYDELHPREEIIKDVSNYGVVDNTYYYIKDGKRHVITDRLLVFGRTDFFKK